MPSEPENKIEELLKAYAKKRREDAGAPFELHPATRKLLQGEVARRQPAAGTAAPSFFQLLAKLWPGVAVAGAMVVVLGVVIWISNPNSASDPQLASAKKPASDFYRDAESGERYKIEGPQANADKTPSERQRVDEVLSAGGAPASPKASAERPPSVALSSEPLPAPGNAPVMLSDNRDTTLQLKGGQLADASPRELGRREALAEADTGKAQDSYAAAGAVKQTDSLAFIKPSGSAVGGAQRSYASAQAGLASGLGAAKESLDRDAKLSLNSPVDRGVKDGIGVSSRRMNESEKTVRLSAELAPQNARNAILSPTKEDLAKKLDTTKATPTPALRSEVESLAAAKNEAVDQPEGAIKTTSLARQLAPTASAALNGQRAHFSQMNETPNAGLTPARGSPALLNAFDFEQTGTRIRIYDADGSIYEGQIAANARSAGSAGTDLKAKRSPSAPAQKPSPAESSEEGLAQQGIPFQASGRSRSLDQLVVIRGTMISATNLPAAPESKPATSPESKSVLVAPASPAAAVNRARSITSGDRPDSAAEARSAIREDLPSITGPVLRIQGTAKIGATNEMQIDAIPAPR